MLVLLGAKPGIVPDFKDTISGVCIATESGKNYFISSKEPERLDAAIGAAMAVAKVQNPTP